ncbi:KLH24-like protein [Mya arenaria]|uniref:KLH24-like protein n=1 Tax=Mya arenaria TaxID=6604 RepID=A0ABY7G0L7_MYAAR|nr:KLH24-like protein [Mya arenaria]
MASLLPSDEEEEDVASYNSGEHSGYLISNMEQFRVDAGFTDITIEVESRQFDCHKFIYTGKVSITALIVEDLFAQAHIFQIQTLVNLCVDFFQKNMKEHNCLSALTLGDIHAHRKLYLYAKNFSCQHFQSLVQDEDLYKLSGECIVDLLKDRRLECENEELVFETAVKWLEFDITARKSQRYKVLEMVKFPMMRKTFLIDVVAKSTHVMNDDRGRELLDDGILFHTIPARRHQLPLYQITPRLNMPFSEVAILLGGRLADGLSNEVECFVADTNEFFNLKQLPFKKRNEFSVCTIGNEIYVSGGLRSSEFWKYDPTFDTWLRGPNLIHARRRHGMSAVDDTIFILGGFDEDNVLATVEYWDIDSNRWEEGGPLNQPVENMGYVAFGKSIYLFGGKNNDEVVTNCVQCYDTLTKTCTTLTCDLPANDMCLSAVVFNSYIYVVGLEGVFRFSPDRDNWDILPDMSCARDFVSLAVLDEKLYALGGRRRGAKDNLYTELIECYDPETNFWHKAGTMQVPMYSYGCVRIFLSKNLPVTRGDFPAQSR